MKELGRENEDGGRKKRERARLYLFFHLLFRKKGEANKRVDKVTKTVKCKDREYMQ